MSSNVIQTCQDSVRCIFIAIDDLDDDRCVCIAIDELDDMKWGDCSFDVSI